MGRPSWRDAGRGTMVRAALWLLSEVGEGNIFTKAQLREAFPETAQIDRRMRDLRSYGWRIDTNREDVTLNPSEQRFVSVGLEVWKSGQARSKSGPTVSATRRREVMMADGFLCRVCGIAGGEPYAGEVECAQLELARREVLKPGGRVEVELVTECKRCRVGGIGATADLRSLLKKISSLSSMERNVLAKWVADDRRDLSVLELIWAGYRTLPAESREAVRQAVGEA